MAKKTRKASKTQTASHSSAIRVLAGIACFAAGAAALLALWTYAPAAPAKNLAGPFGFFTAGALHAGFGVLAWLAPAAMLGLAGTLVAGRPRPSWRWAAWALSAASVGALAHLWTGRAGGGALGAALGGAAQGVLSLWGGTIALAALLAGALVLATDLAAARWAAWTGRHVFAALHWGARASVATLKDLRPPEADDDGSADAPDDADEPDARDAAKREEPEALPTKKDKRARPVLEAGEDARLPVVVAPDQKPKVIVPPEAKRARPLPDALDADDLDAPPTPAFEAPDGPVAQDGRRGRGAPLDVAAPAKEAKAEKAAAPPKAEEKLAAPVQQSTEPRLAAPAIIEPKAPPKPVAAPAAPPEPFTMKDGRKAFTLPSSTLLHSEQQQVQQIDRLALTATAEKLRLKLRHFGIEGQVTEIRPGPVVTMFEFKPAEGVKISKIAALSDDLAMAMEALRVRIVAPIPGKGVVGIEVPNRERQTVFLRDLVDQDSFQRAASKLTMCMGKDIEGMPYITDLAKMPHLLIAGTTGSGKSVGVNAMIVSMLLKASPEDLRFIMVDPKMLELSVYEGIPHLLLPVVTDSKKAAMALRWGVEEMERRYHLLADLGVRNITSYNKKVAELAKEAKSAPPASTLEGEDARDGRSEPGGRSPTASPAGGGGEVPHTHDKLPYLVIIIDELADLMMVASREVEVYIARLAQMARAAGIHLMVATQRPSTDVVTGVIKANFPARISFQVASRHDSMTIINAPGAENLLGMGDMLIIPPGTSYQTRVHGALVTEVEVAKIVDAWKAQGAPVYDANILKARPEDGEGFDEVDDGPDELYDQAIAAVSDMRQVSISLLQRKLRVGYNRSARMIERMEKDGIVGPADGSKPREVLIRALGEMPGA